MSETDPRPLLTLPEAAEYLNISPRLARKLVETRALPSVKVGRLVRIAPSALDNYLTANTRGAAS